MADDNSQVRNRWKEAARTAIRSYESTTEKRNYPFAHSVISSVIEAVAFISKDGPAGLFNGCLNAIPFETLALAAVARTGIVTTLAFEAPVYGPKYKTIRNHAISYSIRRPESCHALQLSLYKARMLAIAQNRAYGLSNEDNFTVGTSDSDESADNLSVVSEGPGSGTSRMSNSGRISRGP